MPIQWDNVCSECVSGPAALSCRTYPSVLSDISYGTRDIESRDRPGFYLRSDLGGQGLQGLSLLAAVFGHFPDWRLKQTHLTHHQDYIQYELLNVGLL